MTHGVSFLPYVDEIVVLVNGEVSEVGSYNSLRASRGAFSEFLDTYAKDQRKQTPSESSNYTFLTLQFECNHFVKHKCKLLLECIDELM